MLNMENLSSIGQQEWKSYSLVYAIEDPDAIVCASTRAFCLFYSFSYKDQYFEIPSIYGKEVGQN